MLRLLSIGLQIHLCARVCASHSCAILASERTFGALLASPSAAIVLCATTAYASTLEFTVSTVVFDLSAARQPPELILGSMSTEHTIYWS